MTKLSQQELDRRLIEAAATGDITSAHDLIDQGADPFCHLEEPLYQAVLNRHDDMARLLVGIKAYELEGTSSIDDSPHRWALEEFLSVLHDSDLHNMAMPSDRTMDELFKHPGMVRLFVVAERLNVHEGLVVMARIEDSVGVDYMLEKGGNPAHYSGMAIKAAMKNGHVEMATALMEKADSSDPAALYRDLVHAALNFRSPDFLEAVLTSSRGCAWEKNCDGMLSVSIPDAPLEMVQTIADHLRDKKSDMQDFHMSVLKAAAMKGGRNLPVADWCVRQAELDLTDICHIIPQVNDVVATRVLQWHPEIVWEKAFSGVDGIMGQIVDGVDEAFRKEEQTNLKRLSVLLEKDFSTTGLRKTDPQTGETGLHMAVKAGLIDQLAQSDAKIDMSMLITADKKGLRVVDHLFARGELHKAFDPRLWQTPAVELEKFYDCLPERMTVVLDYQELVAKPKAQGLRQRLRRHAPAKPRMGGI